MKTKIVTYLIAMSSISILLTSCSTTNQVASSFGKRKYMKGYYLNLPTANTAISASNQAPPLPAKSEVVKTETPGIVTTELAGQAKAQLVRASSSKLKEKIYKTVVRVTTILTRGNTGVAVTTTKQTEQKAINPPNAQGITEYHHGESAGGSGNSSLDWAALLGFVLAFLLPPAGLVLCIIGLKSTYDHLALAGIVISAVIMFFAIAIIVITATT